MIINLDIKKDQTGMIISNGFNLVVVLLQKSQIVSLAGYDY